MKKRIIIIIVAIVLVLGGILAAVLLPGYLEEKKHEELGAILMQTKFDDYLPKDGSFTNMTYCEVLDEFQLSNYNKHDYRYTCNENIPQYDQIVKKGNIDKYDYVCTHIQNLTRSENGNRIVDYSLNAIFAIDKKTKKVIPFATAQDSNNFKLENLYDPSAMMVFVYDYILLEIQFS